MRVYIAARFERRVAIRPWAARVWELGHEMLSTWLQETSRLSALTTDEFFRKLAIKDLCEVYRADLLILETLEQSERGGKENEYGFALGGFQNKLLWIVGPYRSVFHHLADRRFDTWEECIEALRTLKGDR